MDDQEDLVENSRPRLELDLSGLVDAAKLIDDAMNIVVLTGPGVSVSCGILDFRSAACMTPCWSASPWRIHRPCRRSFERRAEASHTLSKIK